MESAAKNNKAVESTQKAKKTDIKTKQKVTDKV